MTRTREETRAYIESAPYPLEGLPINKRGLSGDEGYGLAALAAARAMLIVCEEDPSLLDVPSRESDPHGFARASHDANWKAACARWPGLDAWLGGISRFMFGWANNAVRYALGAEQIGNPALITVGE